MPERRMQNLQDHDLLIELRTEMQGVRSDIKDLKDGTAARLNILENDHVTTRQFGDHETRLRAIEETNPQTTAYKTNKLWAWGWMAVGGLGVINLGISIYLAVHH